MNKLARIVALIILSPLCHSAFASAFIQDSNPVGSCNTHTQMKFVSNRGTWRVQAV